jgi:hypothetical protein
VHNNNNNDNNVFINGAVIQQNRSSVKVLISIGKRPNVFADNIIWTWDTKHGNGDDMTTISEIGDYSKNGTTHHNQQRNYVDRFESFYIPTSSPNFTSGIYFVAVQTTGLILEKPQCYDLYFELDSWFPRKL